MAWQRIVVNAYSLLERWPEVAPGKPRHADLSKEELINRLTQYYDSCGTPITVLFEEEAPRTGSGLFLSTPEVEVIFRPARGAEHFIERLLSHRNSGGDVLVVTDNAGERASVQAAGGKLTDCATFVRMVEETLNEFKQHLSQYNQTEQLKFQTH